MNKLYLLDTNIISELTKSVQNQSVVNKLIENQSLSALSTLTWAEVMFGIKRLPEGKRKNILFDYYVNTVQKAYAFFDFDIHAAAIYSDIKARLESLGKLPPELDLQIASIAIANNLILVTRNVQDFTQIAENSALMIEDWFTK